MDCRICRSCCRRVPGRRFAGHHLRCNQCRGKSYKLSQSLDHHRSRRVSLNALFSALSSRSSSEILLRLCDYSAAQIGTDLPGLAKLIGEHYNDPLCTSAQKLKICRTLWHLHVSALGPVDPPAVDPGDVLRKLHTEGQLVPILRKMLSAGLITLDDIDPPG